MKTCDNTSVGAIIFDSDGRLLIFDRNTDPPGVAGPAGHIDDHGTADDAVIAEVAEEVGLTVTSLDFIAEKWQPNQCRRLPGPAGVGHHWVVYQVEVTGELLPSARETRNARWADRHELQPPTACCLPDDPVSLIIEMIMQSTRSTGCWTASASGHSVSLETRVHRVDCAARQAVISSAAARET